MTRRALLGAFVLGAASALVTSQVVSQEGVREAPPEGEEMMAMWKEISTPGAAHRKLDRFVGSWDVTTRLWMSPTDPPEESEGTSTDRWILGGRFLQSEMHGSMMGMPFEGMGLLGYDNFKKKYVMAWVDSNSTAMYTAEGLADQTGTVFTFYGTMDEFLTGEHDKPVKYVYRIKDQDNYVFEIHDLGIVPGQTKVVEMQSRRKSPDS